ncbi:hypothetical protein D3C72_1671370 [compost metagenome]
MAAVFIGEVAEGAGDGLVHHHLAQLAHDEKRDDAGQRVAEQHGRAGHLDGLGNAQEEPGADGAAKGNQLDVTILQATLKRAVLLGGVHGVVSSTYLAILVEWRSRLFGGGRYENTAGAGSSGGREGSGVPGGRLTR